jgi:hypothetical protein
MEGTVIPLAVTVMGAPLGYLGGGGRTLVVVHCTSALKDSTGMRYARAATYNMAELGSLWA